MTLIKKNEQNSLKIWREDKESRKEMFIII